MGKIFAPPPLEKILGAPLTGIVTFSDKQRNAYILLGAGVLVETGIPITSPESDSQLE